MLTYIHGPRRTGKTILARALLDQFSKEGYKPIYLDEPSPASRAAVHARLDQLKGKGEVEIHPRSMIHGADRIIVVDNELDPELEGRSTVLVATERLG